MINLQFILLMILFILLVISTGRYLYKVITGDKSGSDIIFNGIDGLIYKLAGIDRKEMSYKEYTLALLFTNGIMTIIAFIVLKLQGFISLFNPNNTGNMETSLAINTAISFMTNTNLQNYSGENGLSHFSQMIVIIFMMFTSAATGLAVAAAFIRLLTGKKSLGNFYVDLTRAITRVLLPFSIIVGIILIANGVPQTLKGVQTIKTIEGIYQNIPLGPVAALESIKHIGTNGGGFFNGNSAHPFENPNGITNFIEMLSMMFLPGTIIISFGIALKNRKQGWVLFVAALVLFLGSFAAIYFSEKNGNPILNSLGLSNSMGNMEGKEARFGLEASSLFTTITTAFTTGSVNTAHDSLTPLGGLGAMWNMMLNVVFGGKGVGFMGLIMNSILTVFICGLMVGRTPEFLGKKIEGKEIKLIAFTILVHPIIILVPTAISLVTSVGKASIANPGFHGLSEVLYEFTTSAANNGSAFAGLAGNTVYYNIFTALVILLGRYISMILLLAVAYSLAQKREVPETVGTFRADNSIFALMLIFIIVVVGALTFLPAVALGPISEYLTFR